MKTVKAIFEKIPQRLRAGFLWIKQSRMRISISLIILLAILYLGYTKTGATQATVEYTTEQAEKGTLVKSVSGSGTISSSNIVSLTTEISGVVGTIYVKPGDSVVQGQKIAEINPDVQAQQKRAAAWASYLSAQNSLKSAQVSKLAADSSMWSDRKAYLDAQNTANYKNSNTTNPSTHSDYTDLEKMSIDNTLVTTQKAFAASEQKYKDADQAIITATAQLNSSWLSYQLLSATITAPVAGTVNTLSLTPGTLITGSTTSSNSNSSSPEKIGSISTSQGEIQANVNLSEIDAVNIATGQKATLTLDALPDKTFTGTVTAIDTTGTVSSGVTTYATTITFDPGQNHIYPNMAVIAKIITGVKNDVILVPSAAVTTTNGSSTVKTLTNGVTKDVQVEIGESNDTQTEIVSGIKEGDNVVTSSTNTSAKTTTSSTTTSPFSAFGGRGFGGASAGRATGR